MRGCKGYLANDVRYFLILPVERRHKYGAGEVCFAAAVAAVEYVVLAAEAVFNILRWGDEGGFCLFELDINGGVAFLFRTIAGNFFTYGHFILLCILKIECIVNYSTRAVRKMLKFVERGEIII